MADKQKAPETDKSKLIKIGIVVVVLGIVGWQVMGLMGGGSSSSSSGITSSGQQKTRVIPNPNIPKPASLMKKEPEQMTDREKQLMALQQQTEAKYVAAMNELQMLRIEKEIAITNKEISAAKLDTIAAQKGIVELLEPPKPKVDPATQYAQGLESQQAQTQQSSQQKIEQPVIQQPSAPAVNYTVISVSRLQGKWQAVLGADGKLYHVSVGDVLGAAGTVVIAIDESGVLLETGGRQQKISMVPII